MTGPDRAPVPDDAARSLVTDTGLHRTLFVEAGAGSGKTTQLVERIVNLVAREGVRLTELAAITFTEAAASELQARVRVRFEREAVTATDPTRRERSLQAIADADLAAITTLHGFAGRLLGEFAVDAHLPPRVGVLDEVSSQLAHEDRWARFVDRLHGNPDHHELLHRAFVLGVALEQRYPGQATFRDVADVLGQNWDRITAVAELEPAPLTPLDIAPIAEAVAAIRALPPRCTDPDDKLFLHLQRNVLPQLGALDAIDEPDRYLQIARDLRIGPGNGGRAPAWGGDATGCKEVVKSFATAVETVAASSIDPVLRHLLALTAGEVLAAARARRDEGRLEFHDLLVLARDLLRTNPTVRSTLHARYRCLLLDEFQDTDPLQIDLATLIAASVGHHPPGAWNDLEVEDGRLFFVGDPKQSIYRFRRADIALFLAARDRFGPAGEVKLVTNFRTVGPVVDWVNDLFGTVMADERPGVQPAYEPQVAVRAASPTGDHRPVLIGGPHHDPKVRAGELRAAESTDVAAVLASIRDRPEEWPVFDEATDDWRPARLSDVTVLVPTRSSLPYLRQALAAEAVPYRLATGTLVYDTQEVRDALSVLRAVDDPSDELSHVAALRSPLYACSDADLFTFRHAGGRWDLEAPIPPAVPADHPVRVAAAHLCELREGRWWTGPAELLDRVLRERHANLLAFGDPRPKEVWRRLRFLVDQARAFEESDGGDLRAFLEWAALQGADGARVHEPVLAETDDDAVSIMTIHGAKGLEFPITVLSGLTTRRGGTRPGVSVLWGDDEIPALRLRSDVATADHEPRADLERSMDGHERLRLLYVAATRARDHLVVSCHHRPGDRPEDTYASLLWSHFGQDDDRPDHRWRRPARAATQLGLGLGHGLAATPASPGGTVDVEDPERSDWIRRRTDLLTSQRGSRVRSATAIAEAAHRGTEATTVERDTTEGNTIEGDGIETEESMPLDADPHRGPSVPVRRRGRTGSGIGRAVHGALELIDFADPHDLVAHVARQCDLEAIPDLAATVEAMVRAALAAPILREAATSPHHKEVMVTAPVGDGIVEGYVDLLVERPDGLVVVDYKTDTARSEAQIEAALDRYELQGATYAVALETVTGQPVVDCRFVFCNPSGAIERPVRDLAAATARVRAALAGDPG